ncbi:MAG: type IV pilin protein [bacterium]
MPIKPSFSAVELLLVAGICAILVAIAVPGYMEAKTRAEVADAKNTVLQVYHGIIQYKIDYNKYPEPPAPYGPNPLRRLINSQLITFEPVDRFKENVRDYGDKYSDPYLGYDYISSKIPVYQLTLARLKAKSTYSSNPFSPDMSYYYIKSIGPDQTDFRDEGGARTYNKHNELGLVEYDPTNGVFSLGEIVKFANLQ